MGKNGQNKAFSKPLTPSFVGSNPATPAIKTGKNAYFCPFFILFKHLVPIQSQLKSRLHTRRRFGGLFIAPIIRAGARERAGTLPNGIALRAGVKVLS